MRRRLLEVRADTTLDLTDARLLRPGSERAVTAVLDAGRPDDPEAEGTGAVHLAVEPDAADLADLPQHALRVELSPAEARAVAADLQAAAGEASSGE